jgi:FtsZ-binding cell division protein ZapB
VSGFGDALKALRTVLLMQEDIRQLKEAAKSQSETMARLAEAHGELRARVSRLEGVIEGAAMATRQRRIEE